MTKPALLVMAAGMGSRYGGLKQIEPIGPSGELIIDYSIHDAMAAGFEKIIFIIKKEIETSFRERIGKRIETLVDTDYVFQKIDDIPESFTVPEGRKKPWGTAHAVYSSRHNISGSFGVINADDFYGQSSFKVLYDYLVSVKESSKYNFCMVGFKIENTLTDHGHVARGICVVDKDGYLTDIKERTKIVKSGEHAKYNEGEDKWISIPKGSIASMNMWGFTKGIFEELGNQFPEFFKDNSTSLLDAEYFMPLVVDKLIKDGRASVKVLETVEKWYGITYREDKERVKAAIQTLTETGVYSKHLWGTK